MPTIESLNATKEAFQSCKASRVEIHFEDGRKAVINDTATIQKVKDLIIKEINEQIETELYYE